MLVSLGSDMEAFAVNEVGHHVALCGKIGGTKEKPLQIKGLPKGFMVQEDNVALEFNIPVCYNKVEFVSYMEAMRLQSTNILEKLGLSLSTNASMSFDKKELEHPNALVFGCEPDFDAWSMKENRKPKAKDENLRTCGGHIHVGTKKDMVVGIRNMDLFLGVPSVILDDSPSSVARRELYGKAGAMRPKPYGFEYRVLSNFWMFNNKLIAWVYEQTSTACMFNTVISERDGHRIQECINTGNKELAKELIAQFNIKMPKLAQELFMRFNREKITPDPRLQWHFWFAWYPVPTPHHWCWLEIVYRKGTHYSYIEDSWWSFEYELKGSKT